MSKKSKPPSVRKVDFHGDSIVAVEGKQSRAYKVVVRPTCEALSLDYSSQLKRLRRAPWATVVMTTMVGEDGKLRQMATIPRKVFLQWLLTIDTSRLDEATRTKILRYQLEAQDVLDAAFDDNLDRRTAPGDDDPAGFAGMELITALKAIATAVASLGQRQEDQDRRIAALERPKPARPRRLKPDYPAEPPEGYHILMVWARGPGRLNIPKGRNEGQAQGRKAAEIARRLGVEPIKVFPPGASRPINAYPVEVLEKWKAGFILARPHYRMPQLFGLEWEPCRN